MFNPLLWEALRSGADCRLCRENVDASGTGLVATLESGRVTLQDDADFPGYCILVFRRHAVELTDLTAAERTALIADVDRVARAVQSVGRPAKLNYAILGNEVPHLHVHVIPRYPDDGWWGRPIWLRPADRRRPLPADEFERLRSELAGHLGARGR